MDSPLYDVILGNLPGVREPLEPDPKLRRAAVDGSDDTSANFLVEEMPHNVSATIKPQEGKITPLCVPAIKIGDVSKEKLAEQQQNDKTLKSLFAKVGRNFKSQKGHCYSFF